MIFRAIAGAGVGGMMGLQPCLSHLVPGCGMVLFIPNYGETTPGTKMAVNFLE